nr:MAG TPA: hypothetical protein [Caudoviricetes sp.]
MSRFLKKPYILLTARVGLFFCLICRYVVRKLSVYFYI